MFFDRGQTSMLNLAELLSLRPDLQKLRKVIYFHENQLAYPSQSGCATARGQQDWGCKWGQILSCLVADKIAFNSKYNRDSFLKAIPSLFSKIPKPGRPNAVEIVTQISAKAVVVHFPLQLPEPTSIKNTKKVHGGKNAITSATSSATTRRPLHMVWAHRWEHDKNPELFFRVLTELHTCGCEFMVSVLGERGAHVPAVFGASTQEALATHLVHWGYVEGKDKFWEILCNADVAISTARFVLVCDLLVHWCGVILYTSSARF